MVTHFRTKTDAYSYLLGFMQCLRSIVDLTGELQCSEISHPKRLLIVSQPIYCCKGQQDV